MSFLVRGDVGPRNISEGKIPKNIEGAGLFRSLAQAAMQAGRDNKSGMGLSPRGRRRFKFRMAGEDFAPSFIGSKTPNLFGSKKRVRGAEAVNYSPRTREKDEMERKMKERAEGRKDRPKKGFGSKSRFGERIGQDPFSINTMDFIDSDGNGVDDRYQKGPGQPDYRKGRGDRRRRRREKTRKDLIPSDGRPGIAPKRMSKEDFDQINRRKKKGNMQDTNHSFGML
tara:strand:+ start:54 stop:731 length:678 start_codon:yes stop_codon:yes gene_type:complete